jgi:hypothetical protein
MSEAESRDRTDDLLLTMQPLCQLSYPGGNWQTVNPARQALPRG